MPFTMVPPSKPVVDDTADSVQLTGYEEDDTSITNPTMDPNTPASNAGNNNGIVNDTGNGHHSPSGSLPGSPHLTHPSTLPSPLSSPRDIPGPSESAYQPPLVVDGSRSMGRRRPVPPAGDLEFDNGEGPSSQRIELEGGFPSRQRRRQRRRQHHRQVSHQPVQLPPQQPPQQPPQGPSHWLLDMPTHPSSHEEMFSTYIYGIYGANQPWPTGPGHHLPGQVGNLMQLPSLGHPGPFQNGHAQYNGGGFHPGFGQSMHGYRQHSASSYGSGRGQADVSHGTTPASSQPMSRVATNGSTQSRTATPQSPTGQHPQRAHTASREGDESYVVPDEWYIETPEQLEHYLKSLSQIGSPHGNMYSMDMRGHRLGHEDGCICQIVIKADPIDIPRGQGDALLVVNNLTKLGNNNIASTKRAKTPSIRDYLHQDSIAACMPRVINIHQLGAAAFSTAVNKLSLGEIIRDAKYAKLMFAPQRPAVNLARQYGIYFDSVPDTRQHVPHHGNKTARDKNWPWDVKMSIPTGLIDIQLLHAVLEIGQAPLCDAVWLSPLHEIVSSLTGWKSSLATGDLGKTGPKTDEFDPAIRIQLIDGDQDMPHSFLPSLEPIKFKIGETAVCNYTSDTRRVSKLLTEGLQTHTGSNLFCNMRSAPNNDCQVNLASFCARTVVYLSHLFCIFNTKMYNTRPKRYLTEITLHDVRSHTRHRIRLATDARNAYELPITMSPWNKAWEHQCKYYATQYGKPYYLALGTKPTDTDAEPEFSANKHHKRGNKPRHIGIDSEPR